MRSVMNKEQFTPFGLWIREYQRDSKHGLSVTNLDYVFEDFKRKRIMLVEEKQSNGQLGYAQKLTFQVIDRGLRKVAADLGYEYWGFYLLTIPQNCTMIGPGIKLNDTEVTVEQLRDHLNFDVKACEGNPL